MKSGEKPNLENYSVFFETLIKLFFGYTCKISFCGENVGENRKIKNAIT
jgi:hypothetical protein